MDNLHLKKENKSKGGGGDLLWNKFVLFSLELLNPNGYLLYIHPSGWRKPDGLNVNTKSKYKGIYKKLTNDFKMIYLNINNTEQGLKIFKCGTRFDWYLVKNTDTKTITQIVDEEDKESNIDLSIMPFLPNKNIIKISKIISNNKENNIKVLRPGSDPRRDYISDDKTDKFKHILIHSTPKAGVRYKYSSERKTTDHFDVKKIIFGETGINENLVIDKRGEYGITCCAFGLKIDDNFIKIKNALLSNEFQDITNSCSWSNYRIDWRLFTYFKKEFWKEFI